MSVPLPAQLTELTSDWQQQLPAVSDFSGYIQRLSVWNGLVLAGGQFLCMLRLAPFEFLKTQNVTFLHENNN